MKYDLELQFVENRPEAFVGGCLGLARQGRKTILMRPYNRLAADFATKFAASGGKAQLYALKEECEVPVLDNVSIHGGEAPVDVTAIFAPGGKELSSHLMEYLDLEKGVVVAPITGNYYRNRPLFLISIPKSGTHALYKLAEAFGYGRGVVCRDNPRPGYWHCIEYSNSHTSARDFFIDTTRRSPFGNPHHPFTRSPAIFTSLRPG